MILTEQQVRIYLSHAGFRGTALNNAVKICRCESGFNTNSHNTSGEDSRGLMQINVMAHPEYLNVDLFDPFENTVAAYAVYKKTGNSFAPWTCAYITGVLKRPELITSEKIIVVAIAFVAGVVLYYT